MKRLAASVILFAIGIALFLEMMMRSLNPYGGLTIYATIFGLFAVIPLFRSETGSSPHTVSPISYPRSGSNRRPWSRRGLLTTCCHYSHLTDRFDGLFGADDRHGCWRLEDGTRISTVPEELARAEKSRWTCHGYPNGPGNLPFFQVFIASRPR